MTMNDDTETEKMNMSSRLKAVLDQLASVAIFDQTPSKPEEVKEPDQAL